MSVQNAQEIMPEVIEVKPEKKPRVTFATQAEVKELREYLEAFEQKDKGRMDVVIEGLYGHIDREIKVRSHDTEHAIAHLKARLVEVLDLLEKRDELYERAMRINFVFSIVLAIMVTLLLIFK